MSKDKNNINRLEFTINNGLAKGWKAYLTHECLDWHIREYGGMRPEITDDDFIDKCVVNTIKKPRIIYPSVELNNHKELICRDALIFLKETINFNFPFLVDGKRKRDFIKVVVERNFKNKELKILTCFLTPWIGVDKYVHPITNITQKKFKTINKHKLYYK
jgi:hypothetical protein